MAKILKKKTIKKRVKKPTVVKKRKPSLKQLNAFKNTLKNRGNLTKAMIDAGYAPVTSHNPKKNLTNSKVWNDLMETHISLSKLAKVHDEMLEAQKLQVVNKNPVMMIDNDARIKAMDLGYKLHGKYAPDQLEITRRKYSGFSNKELLEKKEKARKFLTKE